MMGGLGRDGARHGFDRMEDRVLQMEAEAYVAGELKCAVKSLDEELAALGNSDVDRELEEIKEWLKKDKA